MQGIELSRRYFLEYGDELFSGVEYLRPLVAIGLVGCGSECLGFDDEISQDHDFEPSFCIFLPDEDMVSRRDAFLLERAYAKLPSEFMGFKRQKYDAVGGNRHGVIRMSEFFTEKCGAHDGNLSKRDWFSVPEQSLAEATGGEVFFDGLGRFSEIRARLSYLPEDVRVKKLAGNLLLMAQSGQYNYERCIARGDSAAAQLAVIEFVKAAIHAIFLLNKRYMPYYKWTFRALRDLPMLSHLATDLEYLISSGNTADEVQKKTELVEKIALDIVAKLRVDSLTDFCRDDLEGHAYSVNNKIHDPEIRNLHILYGV